MKYQMGLLVLSAAALAACSTSSNNASTNNPLAGVTIIQPTPTPVATPSPAPTASPTPAPMSTEALTDTGFESGGFSAGWTACSYPHVAPGSTATPGAPVTAAQVGADIVSAGSPAFQVASTPAPATTPAIHAGTYSALTFSGTGAQTTYPTAGGGKAGTAGANGVCQTFTVPTSGVLSMYVNEGGSDTGLKYADQEADIISPTSGAVIANLFYELNDPPNGGADTGGTWEQRGPYALTGAPYNLTAGQSVTLFIGSYDSSPASYYGVYMFVDDVTVTGTTAAAAAHAVHPAVRKLGPSH